MPSYVNIGARVGCRHDGRHLGHGRLLRPDRRPGAPLGWCRHRRGARTAQRRAGHGRGRRLIGSRCMVTQGARVGDGAVLGEGTILNPSIPVIDAETGEEISRGVVPPWCVAIGAVPAPGLPGGGVLRAVRARDQAARPGRAPRQGPARRGAARAQLSPVTITRPGRDRSPGPDGRARRHPVGEPRGSRAGRPRGGGAAPRSGISTVDRFGDTVVARTVLGRPRRRAARRSPRHRAPRRHAAATGSTATCCRAGRGRHEGRPGRHARPGPHGRRRRPSTSPSSSTPAKRSSGATTGSNAPRVASSPSILGGRRRGPGRAHRRLGRSRMPGDDAGGGDARPGGGPTRPDRGPGVNAIHRLAPVLRRPGGLRAAPRRARRLRVHRAAPGRRRRAAAWPATSFPTEAVFTVNYRFAPDRDIAEAEAEFAPTPRRRARPSRRATACEVIDAVAGAPPGLDHPLLAGLVEATGQPPRAKLGWTDVATFRPPASRRPTSVRATRSWPTPRTSTCRAAELTGVRDALSSRAHTAPEAGPAHQSGHGPGGRASEAAQDGDDLAVDGHVRRVELHRATALGWPV